MTSANCAAWPPWLAVLLMASVSAGRVTASGVEFDLTPETMTNSGVIVKASLDSSSGQTMEHLQIVMTSSDRVKAEDWEAVLWTYAGTNLISKSPLKGRIILPGSREMPVGTTEHGMLYECDLSTHLMSSSKVSLTCIVQHGSFFCYWIRPADFLKGIERSTWTENTNLVIYPAGEQLVGVTGLECAYSYRIGNAGLSEVSISTFISPNLHKAWIGPKRDFYIESTSGVVGASLGPGGLVLWCDSLISSTNTSGVTLKTMSDDFDINTELVAVLKALGAETNYDIRAQHTTDLRRSFAPWAFSNGKYSQENSRSTKIISIEVENGELKIAVENPASHFKGTVWIDVVTRKVTKATEDDGDTSANK